MESHCGSVVLSAAALYNDVTMLPIAFSGCVYPRPHGEVSVDRNPRCIAITAFCLESHFGSAGLSIAALYNDVTMLLIALSGCMTPSVLVFRHPFCRFFFIELDCLLHAL